MSSDRSAKRNTAKNAPTKKSLIFTLGVIILVITYVLLRPTLESTLGIQLPNLLHDDSVGRQDDDVDPQVPKTSQPTDTKRGDDADPSRPGAADAESAEYLRDVGGNVKQSPAGLRYRPGSLEGHRIKHILRHASDDPDRDIHGVFDGTANEIFAVIDEAYESAQKGGRRVETERDRSRTVHTVDLGHRVGFIGGRAGRRSGHPPATGIRLVLEGQNVITAFPVKP